MAIRKFKPNTPGTRYMSVSSFDEITKTEPEKSLTVKLSKSGGRNNHGRITTRHRGGGHKRRYRIIDFKSIPLHVCAHWLTKNSAFLTILLDWSFYN